MPAAPAFLAGFGLVSGAPFGGFVLTSVNATHETITRYHDYLYRITAVFTGTGTYENLYGALVQKITAHREILSDYGNPYDCWIDAPTERRQNPNGSYTFHLVGHSRRVYR